MEATVIAAIIGAVGVVTAAVVAVAKKTTHLEIDLRGSHSAPQPPAQWPPASVKGVAKVDPVPVAPEFMSDEYLIELGTQLELNASPQDELKLNEKPPKSLQ